MLGEHEAGGSSPSSPTGVQLSGRARGLGPRGRPFGSDHPDHAVLLSWHERPVEPGRPQVRLLETARGRGSMAELQPSKGRSAS